MAILVLGQTVCPICGMVIQDGQKSVSFPAFVGNRLDPLILFNDSAFHEACFRQHHLAETATMLLRQMEARTAPRNRRCVVCGNPINDPDDYVTLGHLVTDKGHALFIHNFAQFHLSCLAKWSERDSVRKLLADLRASGKWQGESLEWILNRL